MIRIRTQGAAVGRALGFLVVTLVGAVLLMTSEPAGAAFPGTNGKIAFASNRVTLLNLQGDFEIFSMNPNGTGVKQLISSDDADSSPAWSADGEQIAFASNRDGDFEIFTMNADGSNQINRTKHPAFDAEPDWQPQ